LIGTGKLIFVYFFYKKDKNQILLIFFLKKKRNNTIVPFLEISIPPNEQAALEVGARF